MSSGCCALLGMAEPVPGELMFAMVMFVGYGVGYGWCGLLRESSNFLGCNITIEDDAERAEVHALN